MPQPTSLHASETSGCCCALAMVVTSARVQEHGPQAPCAQVVSTMVVSTRQAVGSPVSTQARNICNTHPKTYAYPAQKHMCTQPNNICLPSPESQTEQYEASESCEARQQQQQQRQSSRTPSLPTRKPWRLILSLPSCLALALLSSTCKHQLAERFHTQKYRSPTVRGTHKQCTCA